MHDLMITYITYNDIVNDLETFQTWSTPMDLFLVKYIAHTSWFKHNGRKHIFTCTYHSIRTTTRHFFLVYTN